MCICNLVSFLRMHSCGFIVTGMIQTRLKNLIDLSCLEAILKFHYFIFSLNLTLPALFGSD